MGLQIRDAALSPTSEYMTDQSVIYNKIADLASPNFPPELSSQRPVIRPRPIHPPPRVQPSSNGKCHIRRNKVWRALTAMVRDVHIPSSRSVIAVTNELRPM